MTTMTATTGRRRITIGGLLRHPGAGVVIAFVVLCVVLSVTSPDFLTVSNITIVLRQSTWVAIMAVGMTFVIGMGGIDLSVGAILGITGVFAAALVQGGMNIYLAVLIAIVAGAAIGVVNGILVTVFRIPPFIATLGTMSTLRGLILVLTGGIPIYGLSYPEFSWWGQGFLGPVPAPVVILVVVVAVFGFVLYRTRLGRYTLSVGSNPTAARLAGINVDGVKVAVYGISGLLCGIAGIILTSRSEAATPDAGTGLELNVIAATIIGGTAMTGGRAVIFGTVVGAVLMTTISNGLNLLGVSALWPQVIIGIFILVAVAASSMSKSKSELD
ncbi:MAG: Ribose transporter permease [Actinomycetia bacterium]|jgi:ribose transport system permease protein|nr:Ribose transporter permease [Actinomycetes bacterium]